MSDPANGAESADEIVDVAVVGGGIAGVYAAWRLKAETGRSVHLYELSDRIGGRLHTVIPPGMPHLRAELGAMRYNTDQKLTDSLVKALGLKTVPFFCNDARLVFLRGEHLLAPNGEPTGKMPYNLAPSQQNKSPIDLLKDAITSVVPDAFELAPQALDEKLARTNLSGKPLFEVGFWNLLFDRLGSEAYQFVFDSFGIESAFSNWNAAQAITVCVRLLKFAFVGPDVVFNTLEDGLSALPLSLVQRFEQSGGRTLCKHRLLGFHRKSSDPSAPLELRFRDERAHSERLVLARSLVLAMPLRSLELLDQDSLLFEDEGFRKNLYGVSREQAFRLYLGYEERWWGRGDVPWKTGYSITTLPLRQALYWGTEGDMEGADPANQRSLLMASYLDSGSVAFWKPLESTPRFEGETGALAAIDEPPPAPSLPEMPNNAPLGMVETVGRQLLELQGVPALPKPYIACYYNWDVDPFGAAWHLWKPNFDASTLIPKMRRPVAGAPVFLCGEAYSNMQGWIEGALCSAELVLEEGFEMSRPAWLAPTYYLGP